MATSGHPRGPGGGMPGTAGRLTAAQIKAAYESNPDTNALTDARLALLVRAGMLVIPADAQVRSYNANTIVTAVQRGWTFRATGAATRLLSIPNASGAGEVPDGWEMVAANGSSVDQTVNPNGTDRIGGGAALTLAPGRAVRLQKVASGQWVVIADTKDEVGSGAAFMPTKVNLYEAVKAIFVHNTAVSADDPNSELDFAAGAAGALADNSIAPGKARANAVSEKKAWRERLASSSIGLVANALPAVANHNTGDTLIIGRGGETVVPFREVAAPADELTDTVAGDVMMLLAAGWTRIGNLFSGSPAAAAARAIAEANRDRLMVSLTQGDFYGGSAAAIQGTYHINVESMPGAFPTANVVQVWIGDPGISRVLAQTWRPADVQRNLEFEISALVADNLATNGLVDIGDELGVEIRLIAPGGIELYREGFQFPVIAKPASARSRFERAVGASPAVLPVGTYELALKVAQASSGSNANRKAHKRILVSDLSAANERMYFRFGNNNVEVTMRYAAASRTLTYAGANINSLKAIGEA